MNAIDNFASPRRAMPAAILLRCRQRGSIAINVAIALSLILIVLLGTEFGYLFYMKRELQKTADLAALAGAQKLRSGDCGSATLVAQLNANGVTKKDSLRNMPFGVEDLARGEIKCGYWDRKIGFQSPAVSGNINAVQVSFEKKPPVLLPFFTFDRTIHASAIAALGDPVASFSVGTKLVSIPGNSLLGNVLKGIGLDLSGTSLLGYDGLANLKITPGGLLAALKIPVSADISVGGLNALLAANNVKIGDLLKAIVTVAGQDQLIDANVELLNLIIAKLRTSDPTSTPKFNTPDFAINLGDLLKITAPDQSANSALNIDINALDLLSTSIGLATQKHAITANLSALNLIKTQVALIEPPSIAIGGIGATAYTGQLRTFTQISTEGIPLIGSIVKLKLPIMIDAVTGKGTLGEKTCKPEIRTPAGVDQAQIDVQASILKLCVGRPGSNPNQENSIFSTSNSCDTNLQDEKLLGVSLLGLDLISLKTHLVVNPLPLNGSVTLMPNETKTLGNDLLLGTTLKDLTNGLLAALLADSLTQSNPAPISAAQRQKLAESLWGTPPCTTSQCRQTRFAQIKDKIENASNGLSGFLGGLTTGTLGILGNLLSLNIPALLSNLQGLVTNLLSTVGGLLSGVLGGLLGDQCIGGGLGGILGNNGTDAGCIKSLADSLVGSTSATGGTAQPNALISLVGFLLQLLQPLLDDLGSKILTPLLQNVLGLHLGQVDVNLRSLDCNAAPMLVY